MQVDQMERESGVARGIIDQVHSSDIQGDQMEGEGGSARSIIEEHYPSDIQGDQMKVKVVVLEASLMNFILRISNVIKW